MTGPENRALPFVSIVMPVRNEEDFIEQGLRSVFVQSYPPELLEVIVVDGDSDDGTREIVERLGADAPFSLRLAANPKRIAPAALNIGIGESKGEVIVRIDGHCEIDRDYVANCVSHLLAGKADGVGGPIETIGDGLRSGAIAAAMSSKFGVGGSAFRTVDDREMYVDSVAFPGYLRETLEKAGPFNEELVRNQDDEYNYRIRGMGGRILLSPDIRSRYYSRSSFGSLWRQYFQYGYWKVRVLQLHPGQMSLRQFVPPLFVAFIVISGLASVFFRPAIWLLAAVLILYAAVNLIASIIAGFRAGIAAIPLISFSYLILHFAYGSGFLKGLAVFRDRWSTGNAAARAANAADKG